ncbi:70 kDa peptidyl-prolyl isomerase [Bienertia sinuspersici]
MENLPELGWLITKFNYRARRCTFGRPPFLVAGKSPLPSPTGSFVITKLYIRHFCGSRLSRRLPSPPSTAAVEMAEDGNLFFKKGDVDSALEKYGFVGVFLTCIAFETGEDRETFVNLTSVVLLNMAACFPRKKEFMLAGKFCTIVLDLNPRNAKALFRRASAAMELGRIEFAVSDLKLGYVIDPSDQEVCKKLGEAGKPRL